jgi:hypothetical protein
MFPRAGLPDKSKKVRFPEHRDDLRTPTGADVKLGILLLIATLC